MLVANMVFCTSKKNNETTEKGFKLLECNQLALDGDSEQAQLTKKITYKYKELKDESTRKYIYYRNFRTFRGLEHFKITVTIKCDTNINLALYAFLYATLL